MKTSISVLLCVLSLLFVNGAASPQHSKGEHPNTNEAEIKALYERWAKAFEARDIEGIMSVYAPGDSVVGLRHCTIAGH